MATSGSDPSDGQGRAATDPAAPWIMAGANLLGRLLGDEARRPQSGPVSSSVLQSVEFDHSGWNVGAASSSINVQRRASTGILGGGANALIVAGIAVAAWLALRGGRSRKG